jgi:hypothetical protein
VKARRGVGERWGLHCLALASEMGWGDGAEGALVSEMALVDGAEEA